jgi:hypothetical protein
VLRETKTSQSPDDDEKPQKHRADGFAFEVSVEIFLFIVSAKQTNVNRRVDEIIDRRETFRLRESVSPVTFQDQEALGFRDYTTQPNRSFAKTGNNRRIQKSAAMPDKKSGFHDCHARGEKNVALLVQGRTSSLGSESRNSYADEKPER